MDVDVIGSRAAISKTPCVRSSVRIHPNRRTSDRARARAFRGPDLPDRCPRGAALVDLGADPELVWRVLEPETEAASIGGQEVETPNVSARCLIVALHLAQHGVRDLEILDDLERALVLADEATWRRASELASAANAEAPFAGALSVTSRGIGPPSIARLRSPKLSDRQALSLITPAPSATGFYFLSRERSRRSKLVFVRRKLAPSPEFMRLRYPVARRGSAGLLTAYLYRPFWLLRWVVPGFRSWRKAQELAANSGDDVVGERQRPKTPVDLEVALSAPVPQTRLDANRWVADS